MSANEIINFVSNITRSDLEKMDKWELMVLGNELDNLRLDIIKVQRMSQSCRKNSYI